MLKVRHLNLCRSGSGSGNSGRCRCRCRCRFSGRALILGAHRAASFRLSSGSGLGEFDSAIATISSVLLRCLPLGGALLARRGRGRCRRRRWRRGASGSPPALARRRTPVRSIEARIHRASVLLLSPLSAVPRGEPTHHRQASKQPNNNNRAEANRRETRKSVRTPENDAESNGRLEEGHRAISGSGRALPHTQTAIHSFSRSPSSPSSHTHSPTRTLRLISLAIRFRDG